VLQILKHLIHSRPEATIRRSLIMGGASLAAVLWLFFMQALEGQWTWMIHRDDHLWRHLPQLSAEALPIPIAFILWAQLMEKLDGKFVLCFSPSFGAFTIAFLIAGVGVIAFPQLQQLMIQFMTAEHALDAFRRFQLIMFVAGVITGLFVVVPVGECLKRVIRHPRPAIVAIIAASAAANYYWLMRIMWEQMCNWTLTGVYSFLSIFHMNIAGHVWSPSDTVTSLVIESPYFVIRVDPSCNGLEGIFLFNFMLSVMLLVDWELFKRRSLILLYGFGVLYMFVINILRISLFFTLGYWAYRPNAWKWVQGLRGAPVYLFHSYVGWVFYLAAFGIFAAWLYRKRTTGLPLRT